MRHSLSAFVQGSARLHRGAQELSQQLHRQPARDLSVNQFQQYGMVDLIEEGLQINVYHMLITFVDVPLGLQHGLMSVAVGAESVTAGLEVRLKYRLTRLMQGLLDNPVGQRRDAEHPRFAVRFGYFHAFDWAGLIASIADMLYYILAVSLQVGIELGYFHPVHPTCSFIGTDLLVGFVQIPLLDYVFYHCWFIQAASFSSSYPDSRIAILSEPELWPPSDAWYHSVLHPNQPVGTTMTSADFPHLWRGISPDKCVRDRPG